jgi:hypothetical protein
LPEGLTGGVSAVAINSKEHLFAFQRNPAGKPQLFEFDQNHNLVRTIGENVIGHQNKAHGMAIDASRALYVTGQTSSPDFPAPHNSGEVTEIEVFVCKLSADLGE